MFVYVCSYRTLPPWFDFVMYFGKHKKNARYLSKDVKPIIFVINLDYFTKYILRYNNLLNFFLCKNQIFPKLLKSFQQLAGASLCVLGAPTTRLVKDIQARPSKIVGEEILLTFI